MKKFYRIVLIVFVLNTFFLLTCKNSAIENKSNHINISERAASLKDWTILIFMNGDNNLEEAAINDFMEMSKVGSNEMVNLIAQVDLIGKYYNIGWTQTLRFFITKGMTPIQQNAVMDIGEANMGDKMVLGDFVNWAMQKYPAKKFALVIWDHGQGYRFYFANKQFTKDINAYITNMSDSMKKESINSVSNLANVHLAINDPFRSSSQSPFKSCSNDETNNDELYNREIQDGLSIALKGKKLDLLGFDACLMAMVETGYAMRNVSANFVGSEELEPGTGWKYDDWLSKLSTKPTMDGKELSKTIVESYGETYGSFSTNTLSAVDITSFGSVADKISKMAQSLINKINNELPAIKAARKECAAYAPNPYNVYPPKDYFFHVDFIRFCDQLIEHTKDLELKNDTRMARDAVVNVIIKNFRGDLRADKFGSNGLAIYFPESNAQYKEDVFEKGGYTKDNTYYPVEFVQNQKWADFLHVYFQHVQNL